VSYLIDTNVISELRKRDRAHPAVLRWVELTPPAELHTSVLVIGEIRRGVELKRRRDPVQATRLEHWLQGVVHKFFGRILAVDQRIAEAWGRFGIPDPVPDIDGLLAATASVYGLAHVTRDCGAVARHGVSVVNPFTFQ
jgi:toxin FitB